MSRRRYVWRVTATWPDRTDVRHYQSEAAARHRAAVLLGAVEPTNPELRQWYPHATSVVIERSAPVDGWTVVQS